MTLARRLGVQLSLLIACLVGTAAVGLWGVAGVRQDFSIALRNYERLRDLYQVGFHLQSARLALALEFADPQRARLEAKRAGTVFDQLSPSLSDAPERLVEAAREALQRAAREADAQRPSVRLVDAPLASLNELVDSLRRQIQDAQRAADERTTRTVTLLGLAALAAVVASLIVGWRQFRAVMSPLGAITAGTHRLAAGAFDRPIQLSGTDAEFAALAGDFNVMADRLRGTYADLQSRVESATRVAVQSERMAGVGLLAAGVAHEINNPLSIITGRLELMLAKPTLDASLRPQVEVVLEEAFRCKQIIDRLLMLSRGPSGSRRTVQLDRLVNDVVGSVRTLPAIESRTIDVNAQPLSINADEGELRQVLLNLLINAIQFTQAEGTIAVSLERAGPNADLSVRDDGAGMDGPTLRRLFEPFFSPPADGRRGTGLGLAISRAIVESHGGTIEADSGGAGKGSRFVVRLPIVDDAPTSTDDASATRA